MVPSELGRHRLTGDGNREDQESNSKGNYPITPHCPTVPLTETNQITSYNKSMKLVK